MVIRMKRLNALLDAQNDYEHNLLSYKNSNDPLLLFMVTWFRTSTLVGYFTSLFNVDYRYMNRIATLIISEQQFGFFSGRKIYDAIPRKIHDAIPLALKGTNCLHRANSRNNMAFKVDNWKAFDTLRWGFY